MRTYIILLLLTVTVVGCGSKLFQPSKWFSQGKKFTTPEFSNPDKKAMFVLNKADDLFFVLVIAAVGGLVFGIWARTAIGFYIASACGVGAVALLLLAQFSTYIGYGLLAIAGIGVIILAVRWRQVADAAIEYADDLKRHVADKDAIGLVNATASKTQKRAVQKYIKKRRNGNNRENQVKEKTNV